MPTLTVTRPTTGVVTVPPPPPVGDHPKAELVTEGGLRLVLPYAPTGSSLAGLAPTFGTYDRPGRRPLVLRDAEPLRSLGLEFLLARAHHQSSVEDLLSTLERIGKAGDRVTLVNLSVRERGPWRIGDLSTTVLLRQHGTNAITRASVSVSLLAASDPVTRLGPVTGGAKGPKPPGIRHPRHYVIKRGDTLRKLARRFYGEPNEWRRIARRNHLRDPNNLPVGRRIVIPADDKD